MKNASFFIFISITMLLMSQFASAQKASKDNSFATMDNYSDLRISPNGNYISYIAKEHNKRVLYIYDIATNKIINVIRFHNDEQVKSYAWAASERLVLSKEYISSKTKKPVYVGEIYSINADGSKGKYLLGHKLRDQVGTNFKQIRPLPGTSFILDPLPNEDRFMLILNMPWQKVKAQKPEIYKVNIYNGSRSRVTSTPELDSIVITNKQGFVKAALSNHNETNQVIHIRQADTGTWNKLEIDPSYLKINLLTFDESGKKLYFVAKKSGVRDIYQVDLDSKQVQPLLKEERSNTQLLFNSVDNSLLALNNHSSNPNIKTLNQGQPILNKLNTFTSHLPNYTISQISSSLDDSVSIVTATKKTGEKSYYFYGESDQEPKLILHSNGLVSKQYSGIEEEFNKEKWFWR